MPHRLPAFFLFGALLLALLAPSPRALAQAASFDGRPDQVVLRVGPAAALAATGDYLSAPIAAARPFTHMLLRREAHVPEGATLTLSVRASIDGITWSDWGTPNQNDDLWVESDGPDVWWSETVEVGARARFWQVRGVFTPAPSGALPELRAIDVNTLDASAGDRPGAANAGPAPALTAAAKPAVVSRTQWGSPDGQGSRVRPTHYPVNHLVVHHSADSNSLYPSEPNWAARVRAIWSFHTVTRGWGDIGYNYVIDPNGVIYEGRAGGDDAVAFHDTANYGSMGVVMLGTYDGVAPTQAGQDSLVGLLAWKTAQKGIDPLGSSYYYGCAISKYCLPFNAGAVVPNIAGHRQVTPGHTTCPGDSLLALLPGIRNRVKQALSGGPTNNGDLQIDELESGFARSDATWYDTPCGAGGHTFYTYATDNGAESTNSATWRPDIPARGTYRVYAHIPQGCGLAPPPYASVLATYHIRHAEGSVQRTVNHNGDEAWVDLGLYTFDAGTDGAVELDDLTGEPYSERRVLFFDAVKWVHESTATNIQLDDVQYERTTVASGELLKVTFTVKNTGSTTLRGQAPHVDLSAEGAAGSLDNGHAYDQDECFIGNAAGSYPAFPKESDRFRLVLGIAGWDGAHTATCKGATSDYPWRWGLNADLAPGQQQTIVGYVRFREPGSYTLQAGILQEYVKYYAEGAEPAAITVTPERTAPDMISFDSFIAQTARVYRLGSVPDNLLARTRNPLSIPRGQYVGSFAWDGSFVDWATGGPLEQTDEFLVEQTRPFLAPDSGVYMFRTTSDDGSWLWVDGQEVVSNHGLHSDAVVTGTVTLNAGLHVVAFKYFERTGQAAAGYDVQAPSAQGFSPLPDVSTGGAAHLGSTFVEPPGLTLVADDQGGTGVERISWNLNGQPMGEVDGALLSTGKLQNGSYRLRYEAIDRAGNQSEARELVFVINPELKILRGYLPLIGP